MRPQNSNHAEKQTLKRAIFIGGIHGVGKTTLCKELSKKIGLDHYSASTLIKSLKQDKSNGGSKNVLNIESNQELLISAINCYINKSDYYIIDGHFCVLDKEGKVTKIPKGTFKYINPTRIIVLHDDVSNIQKKIELRDSLMMPSELLSTFQNCEIESAEEIAKDLHVPYLLFDVSHPMSKIELFLDEVMSEG